MLNEAGRIVGEFTVARPDDGDDVLPVRLARRRRSTTRAGSAPTCRPTGASGSRSSGSSLTGLSIAGPHARDVLASITDEDLSTEAFRFMDFRRVDLGMIPALVARINYAGDLGYELWVAPGIPARAVRPVMAAGQEHGIRLFGFRALMSLRLEKSYGTWFREYRPIYTPPRAGITRYLKLDHEFIGRAAHEAELAAGGPARRLVALVVEPDPDDPADVIGDEPIWHGGAVVGWVTSGGYGHHVKQSIALGYVPTALADAGRPGRRRLRDRDHRPAPAGPAPARAAVRPRGRPDAPVTEAASAPTSRAPPDGSSSTGGRSRSRRATRWRSRSCAPARSPGAAGRCAWPATAGTAWRRSTAWRTCGRARSRPGPGWPSSGIRPAAKPPLPVVAGPDLTAPPVGADGASPPRRGGRRGHRRRVGGRARPRGRSRAGRTVVVARRRPRATRSSPSTPGRRSSPGRRAGCSTSMPHEIVVATGAAEIQPVCPGNELAGLVTARAAERLHAAGVDLGRSSRSARRRRRAVRRVAGRARPVRGRRGRPASAPS